MAMLAPKKTYVKLEVNVWMDRKTDSVHLTSNDTDLPSGGMHMTAKKGTQSDRHLRALLTKFDCGPDTKALKNVEGSWFSTACLDGYHQYCSHEYVTPGTVGAKALCSCSCHAL